MGSKTVACDAGARPSPSGRSCHGRSTKKPHTCQPEAAPSPRCCLSHTLFRYYTCHYLKLSALSIWLLVYYWSCSLPSETTTTQNALIERRCWEPGLAAPKSPVRERGSRRSHCMNENHTLTSFRVLCSAAWILWSISSSNSLSCMAALSWALKFKRMHTFS